MSWTVACFCGTVFHTPPDRCPTCDTPLPDVSRNHPIGAGAPSAEVALEHAARVASIRLGARAHDREAWRSEPLVSAHSRPRSAGADRTVGGSVWRTHLKRIGVEQRTLTDRDARVLSLTISGWQVIPSTPAGSAPIAGRVWVAAALNARGRYRAPEIFGHPAQLDDGGRPIDTVILMAVIQRHFLPVPEPAWDDVALARQLAVKRDDIARAQLLIDDTVVLMRRTAAPLGAGWWEHHGEVRR